MSLLDRLRGRGKDKDGEAEGTEPASQRHEPVHGRLDVPTGDNVRELGGFPTADGRVTLSHRFLRSGLTHNLDDEDVAYLLDYGVRRVVDLRSDRECTVRPCRFAAMRGVSYLQEPLYERDVRQGMLAMDSADTIGMVPIYLGILANAPAMRRIFSFMAQAADDSCVLFHCAAGMDRTGVLAAVIEGLCGVDRAHVVADYCYSFVDPDAVDAIVLRGEEVPGVGVGDLADAMGTTWDRVVTRYGDMHGYLRACGVSEFVLRRVRRHLLGPEG